MRSLRYSIKMSGVDVQMLFTPHLYSFKGVQGVTFEIADKGNRMEIYEAYADLMFCAALNAWVLDGYGSAEDFPHRRGDFHEYMMQEPEKFAKGVEFALEALTGKNIRDVAKDAPTAPETAKEEGKKKLRLRWIGKASRRS